MFERGVRRPMQRPAFVVPVLLVLAVALQPNAALLVRAQAARARCAVDDVVTGSCQPAQTLMIDFSGGCTERAKDMAGETAALFADNVRELVLTMSADVNGADTTTACGLPFLDRIVATSPWTMVERLTVRGWFPQVVRSANFNRIFEAIPSVRSLILDGGTIVTLTQAFLAPAFASGRLEALAVHNYPGLALLDLSRIANIDSLRTLSVTNTGCQIAIFNDASNLTTLDISSNRFIALPSAVLDTANLRTVIADYNSIETLIPRGTIQGQPNGGISINTSAPTRESSITKLSLRYNRIPPMKKNALSYYPLLQELYLEHNDVVSIDVAAFARSTRIQVLDFTENSLAAIHPEAFEHMRDLTTLVLSLNVLQSLHLTEALSELRNLDISSNLIETLTFSDGFLRNNALVQLRARNNTLERFQESLTLPMLESLDINGNFLTAIHANTFREMPSLKELSFRTNKVSSLASNLWANNPLLVSINMGHNSFSALDARTFSNLQALQVLELHDNSLTALADTFFHSMPNLLSLALDGNRLSALHPQTFAHNPNLLHVVLSRNELGSLPQDLFANNPRLESLHAGNNKITAIPDNLFAHHPNLTTFAIARNPLTHIAADFFQATTQLQVLNFTATALIELPRFQHLTELKTLSFAQLFVETFDLSEFAGLQKLEFLSLSARRGESPKLIDSSNEFQLPPTLEILFLRGVTIQLSTAHFESLFARMDGSLRLFSMVLTRGFAGGEASVHMTQHTPRVCRALAASVSYLQLAAEGIDTLTLCETRTFSQVVIADSPTLQSLQHNSPISRLVVADARALTTIMVPNVANLDMSRTSIPFNTALCTLHGHSSLIARDILDPSYRNEDTVERLLTVCLRSGGVLDMSGNSWLGPFLNSITATAGQRFILKSGAFVESALERRVNNRVTIPQFTLSDGPIRCVPQFDSLFARTASAEQLDFFQTVELECSCAEGLRYTGSECVQPPINRAAIAGTAIGATLGTLFVAALIVFVYRQFSRQRKERNTLFTRLLNKEDEVEQLKQAWNISHPEVRKITMIAEGTQGKVWLGTFNKMRVAIKYFKDQGPVDSLDQSALTEFQREMDFLREVKHANLVQFYGGGTDVDDRPFLVLQYVPLGSLRDILDLDLTSLLHDSPFKLLPQTASRIGRRRRVQTMNFASSTFVTLEDKGLQAETAIDTVADGGDFVRSNSLYAARRRDEEDGESGECVQDSRYQLISPATRAQFHSVWDLKVSFARDIAAGMLYIHDKNRVHRDLKPQNVLISEGLVAKITDFGCIGERLLEGSDAQNETSRHIYDIGDIDTAGTPLYIAPEVEPGVRCDLFRADVFSFGVMLWEIATQKVPDLVEQEEGTTFQGPYMVKRQSLLLEGKNLMLDMHECNQGRAKWYRDLCLACMDVLPQHRPLFTRISYTLDEYAGTF